MSLIRIGLIGFLNIINGITLNNGNTSECIQFILKKEQFLNAYTMKRLVTKVTIISI